MGSVIHPTDGYPPPSIRSCTVAQNRTVMHQEVRIEQESVSLMYYALPSSIQSRLPSLRSFLKSVNMPRDGPTGSSSSSGSTTPISESETLVAGHGAKEDEITLAKTVNRNNGIALQSSVSGVAVGPLSQQAGVDWRCGRLGW